MIGVLWDDRAWDDYIYWQNQDKKTLKRINALIAISCYNMFDCIDVLFLRYDHDSTGDAKLYME